MPIIPCAAIILTLTVYTWDVMAVLYVFSSVCASTRYCVIIALQIWGRPLMIGGCRKNWKWFFPWEGLLYFFPREWSSNFFPRRRASEFFLSISSNTPLPYSSVLIFKEWYMDCSSMAGSMSGPWAVLRKLGPSVTPVHDSDMLPSLDDQTKIEL